MFVQVSVRLAPDPLTAGVPGVSGAPIGRSGYFTVRDTETVPSAAFTPDHDTEKLDVTWLE